MGMTDRIYGTGGRASGSGEVWTNPANVTGASNADYASSIVALPADASQSLWTDIPATALVGNVTAVTLGIRVSTDVAPVAQAYGISINFHSTAGTQLCFGTFNANVSTTPTDLEVSSALRGGVSWAQVAAAIVAGANTLGGIEVAVSNLDTNPVEFRVESMWLIAQLNAPSGGTGVAGKSKLLPIGIVLP